MSHVVKVCLNCEKERDSKDNIQTTGGGEEQAVQEDVDVSDQSEQAQVEPGMKATATVPPFMNLSMRNHTAEQASNPPPSSSNSSSNNSSEGSFAAALRKLAQQAPGFPISVIPRDRRPGSPLPKNGSDLMPSGIIPHPSPHPSQGSRITGTPSIMAPVNPHNSSLSNVEKQEMLMKATYSHMHPREHSHQLKDVLGRHPNRPQMPPASFPYPERDEHHHRRSQQEQYEREREQHSREAYDHNRRSSITASTSVSLSNHSMKERPSSSIGLVHPQPIRKLHDEESVKSSSMNSMHYPTRDSTAAMRPLSPELSRYGPFVTPRQHQHPHGTGSSCPVHGQESGHHHDERSSRPPGIPFEPPNHGVPRDFHNHHAQHPRMREELQFLHSRHPLERKEHLPSHHALEEDLRRRGLDYRWAGLPPHLLDEQYRRHIINGGHEQHAAAAFKAKAKPNSHIEAPHGQVYLPHFYYGRDYPIPVEPYLAHAGLPPKNDPHQRGHGPPISPRLLDYYRRSEHGMADRSRNEYEAERRAEERREKERACVMRTSSVDSIKNQKQKHEECPTPEKDIHRISPGEKKKEHHHGEPRSNVTTPTAPKMPFFKGLELNSKPPKPSDSSHQPNSINSLLSSSKIPDPKPELAVASILANMNRINQSPCSDEVESLTSSSGMENHMLPDKAIKIEEDEQQLTATEEGEQIPEDKVLYMVTLGLVPHNRKRALEEEFERKRWDRKFRKFRGRPKKRSKRENTNEDSSVNGDTRPGSELDFYSGPMTRHKQQLLQEQECLLEQIQKRHNSDTNEDSTEDMKLLASIENSRSNDNEDDDDDEINAKDNNMNNEINNNNISNDKNNYSGVKSHPLSGDMTSAGGTVNNVYPSRLLAILQDDQQQHQQQKMNNNNNNSNNSNTNSNSNKPSPNPNPGNELTHSQHQELVDGIRVLDNSRFGQPITDSSLDKKFLSWPGVERISLSLSAYNTEFDMTHQQNVKRYEELERDNRQLQKRRGDIQKKLVVYHNRSMDISDQKRDLHQHIESIHSNLRTIMNF